MVASGSPSEWEVCEETSSPGRSSSSCWVPGGVWNEDESFLARSAACLSSAFLWSRSSLRLAAASRLAAFSARTVAATSRCHALASFESRSTVRSPCLGFGVLKSGWLHLLNHSWIERGLLRLRSILRWTKTPFLPSICCSIGLRI